MSKKKNKKDDWFEERLNYILKKYDLDGIKDGFQLLKKAAKVIPTSHKSDDSTQ